jgi:hypothetical protein
MHCATQSAGATLSESSEASSGGANRWFMRSPNGGQLELADAMSALASTS